MIHTVISHLTTLVHSVQIMAGTEKAVGSTKNKTKKINCLLDYLLPGLTVLAIIALIFLLSYACFDKEGSNLAPKSTQDPAPF